MATYIPGRYAHVVRYKWSGEREAWGVEEGFGKAEAYGENKMKNEERLRQNRSLSSLFTFHFSLFT